MYRNPGSEERDQEWRFTEASGSPSSQSPFGEGKYLFVISIATANMIIPKNASTVAITRRTAFTCHLRSCSASRRRVSIEGMAMIDYVRRCEGRQNSERQRDCFGLEVLRW